MTTARVLVVEEPYGEIDQEWLTAYLTAMD